MIIGNTDRTSPVTNLTVKPTATTGPTVRDVENVKSQVDALMQGMNDSVGRLRTDISKVTTDLSKVTSSPAPVGTVISSVVTIAQFQAQYGNFSAQATWILADGRDVAGSEYAKVTGRTTVPDLRGTFLRGSATNANGWVGGSINTYVEDSTRLPRTDFTVTSRDPIRNNGNSRGIAGAAYGSGEAYLFPGLNTNRVDGGDAETRPKHYVVNYYIKIN